VRAEVIGASALFRAVVYPPEQAVVFSFDEKTQVQALDRTQPSLPMTKGTGRDDDA
jgi:hypothetical protein